MEEVPGAGDVHRHAGSVGRLDDRVVTDRSAGLDDRAYAGSHQDLGAVGEREERVGCGDRTGRTFGAGALDSELAGVDPVDLAHADADRGAVLGEQDRVGLHGAARGPGEREVGERRLVGGLAGDQRPASTGRRPRRRRGRRF